MSVNPAADAARNGSGSTLIGSTVNPLPTSPLSPIRANPALAALGFIGLRKSTRPELTTNFGPGASPGRKPGTGKRVLIGGDA